MEKLPIFVTKIGNSKSITNIGNVSTALSW